MGPSGPGVSVPRSQTPVSRVKSGLSTLATVQASESTARARNHAWPPPPTRGVRSHP